ncbi:hypothetical protein Emag_006625 [Eimeria magna]
MTRNPAIRQLALGVFAFLNVALCWLWWQAVLVERHPLPDPCLFPDISNLVLAQLHDDAANQVTETAALSETSNDGLGSCVLSKSVQLQRQQWRLQLEKKLAGSPPQCPGQSVSAPVEELLQWITLLNIVPLCAEAESVAQTVYRRLAALGDAETPATLTKGQCIVLPAATFLEATQRRKSVRSGSSNGLLTIRLSSNAQGSEMCVSVPSSQEAVAAFQEYDDALGERIEEIPPAHVVPHSGLQELEWEHLAPLLLTAKGEEKQNGMTDSAVLEEFRRRVSNLSEEWDADNEYSSSRSINLGLYKPAAAIDVPRNFALMLPFWGFLTFGAPVDSKHLSESEGGAQQFPVIRLETEEEAALTAAWIAQLRALLGLRPAGALDQGAAVPCTAGKQSVACGRVCERRRCMWHVRTIEGSASNTPRALANWIAPPSVKAADDFSLAPEKAVLVSSNGDSTHGAFIFLYPSPRGLTDWEVGGLAADFLSSFAIQASDNIRMLRDVLLNHHDIRIPDHIGRAIRHVMEQLHCSVDALRMRACAFLPTAALELLEQGRQPMTCDTRGAGECASLGSAPRRREANAYAMLALLLARSALKDSKELLLDGSLEPAPFFSTHFNLAIHVPLLFPFVLPTVTTLMRAARALRKKNP